MPDGDEKRATQINQAYSVLRDPQQRAAYDRVRLNGGIGFGSTTHRAAAEAAWRASYVAEDGVAEVVIAPPEPAWLRVLRAPLTALSSAYFLLPGTYEWEPGSNRETVRAVAIPSLGVAAWLLATGRLDGVVGGSLFAVLAIWAMLGVIAVVTVGGVLARLLITGIPTLLLVTGTLDIYLRSAGLPVWLAWVGLTVVSTLVAARVYLFGVLPAVAICWLLSSMA
jgi:hypothetical protein